MAGRARQLGLYGHLAKGDGGGVARVNRGAAKRKRKPGSRPPGPAPRLSRKGFAKHGKRPEHDHRHPVHVTMRRVRMAPSFRQQAIYAVVREEIADAKHHGVRIVQHSIQHDHLHLMVEGDSRADLAKQMCRLFSRIAMAVNRVARRSGPLFRDRHHRRALSTPTEVRNALVYILFNLRKHMAQKADSPAAKRAARRVLDPCSSAPWFTDWHPEARPPPDALAEARRHSPADLTSRPDTWLARVGWRRGGRRGPLRIDEQPVAPF
jgi:putative transposase